MNIDILAIKKRVIFQELIYISVNIHIDVTNPAQGRHTFKIFISKVIFFCLIKKYLGSKCISLIKEHTLKKFEEQKSKYFFRLFIQK